MRKTKITIVSPDDLYADEDIPVDILSKLFSNVWPLADALENGLKLDEGYCLVWTVKWTGHWDNPQEPTISATVMLCCLEQVSMAFDTSKTSPALVSVIGPSKPLLITEKKVSFPDSSGMRVSGDIGEVTPEEIISGILEFIQHLQPEPCTAP